MEANLAAVDGRLDEAVDLALRSAAAARRGGFPWWQANALGAAAEWALDARRVDEAHASAREALTLARSIADRQNIVYSLGLLARIAARTGQSELAGRLWGAIEREEEHGRVGQWEEERDTFERDVLRASGPVFEAGRSVGASLSLERASDEALRDA